MKKMKKEDLKVGLTVTNLNGANGDIVEITEGQVFVQFHEDFVGEAPTPYSMSFFLEAFTK